MRQIYTAPENTPPQYTEYHPARCYQSHDRNKRHYGRYHLYKCEHNYISQRHRHQNCQYLWYSRLSQAAPKARMRQRQEYLLQNCAKDNNTKGKKMSPWATTFISNNVSTNGKNSLKTCSKIRFLPELILIHQKLCRIAYSNK